MKLLTIAQVTKWSFSVIKVAGGFAISDRIAFA